MSENLRPKTNVRNNNEALYNRGVRKAGVDSSGNTTLNKTSAAGTASVEL